MTELEDAGWRKAQDKAADQVTDVDIKSVFNLVDIDKSGTVSRTVSSPDQTRGQTTLLMHFMACIINYITIKNKTHNSCYLH